MSLLIKLKLLKTSTYVSFHVLFVTQSPLIKYQSTLFPGVTHTMEANSSCHGNGLSLFELLETQPDGSDLCLPSLSPFSLSSSSIHPRSHHVLCMLTTTLFFSKLNAAGFKRVSDNNDNQTSKITENMMTWTVQ